MKKNFPQTYKKIYLLRLLFTIFIVLACFLSCKNNSESTMNTITPTIIAPTIASSDDSSTASPSVTPAEDALTEPMHEIDVDPANNKDSEGFLAAEPTLPPEIDYQAVKPNEVGNIMVIMYHGLTESESSDYDRTAEGFLHDLQTLYDQGYRLIPMQDLIDNRISVAAGYTPVILTFDDGRESTFSLIEQDGQLSPKPGCMVDILNRFCDANPDFGKNEGSEGSFAAGVFYINFYAEPFRGSGTIEQRLVYLLDNGYEIGNHTYSHAYLNRSDAAEIQEQIGKMDQLIRQWTNGYMPTTLSYPFGLRPKEDLRPYAISGEYEGQAYEYALAFREGQSTVSACPNHVQFDPYNMPRVRGTDISTPDNEVQDLGYYLRLYQRYPERRYISDGNPDRIAVPESSRHLVDMDRLGDRELFMYQP